MSKMFSRTRIFGIALILYSLLSTGFVYLDFTNHNLEISSNILIFVGGFLMFLAGVIIAARERFDKMYAIGLYAVTYGIYKILKSYNMMNVKFDNFSLDQMQFVDVVSIITIIISIPLILFGISFLLGVAKNIWRKVFVSFFFIMLSGASILVYLFVGDLLMVATEAVEIVLLLFFIFLLLSKDVRVNTVEAKLEYEKKISKNAKKDAKKRYKAALKEADRVKKSGDKKLAKKMKSNAKKRYKEDLAEGKEVSKMAKKKRYYYNEKTEKVEVMKKK